MHEDHTIFIGKREVWGGQQPFGLDRTDRRQHLYLIGKTGVGKTTLLRNLILQAVEAGEGIGVMDPHGDLADEVLDHIPPRRTDDLVYFNPGDQENPIAFNLLQHASPHARHLTTSAIVGAMKSIWRDSWGPRLEYILSGCIAALLECQNTTILGIQRVLTDARYRDWVIKQVKDPAVSAFWLREFAQYDARFVSEIISPIQNKVGQLLMSPLIRNVLGQVSSRFDPRFIMDHRRLFIANLAKGLLGEDKSNLLGSMLVSQFQSAALARADTPENQRPDFTLFIDEYHSFTTDSFASILSEMRKYRLSLVLAGQYLQQTRPEILDAVFGNVGSIVSFRVGQEDSITLARQFANGFHPSQFTDLGNGEVLVKLLKEGRHGEPFLAKTFPPTGKRYGKKYNLIARSRQRYTRPRAVVEDKIRRWMRS